MCHQFWWLKRNAEVTIFPLKYDTWHQRWDSDVNMAFIFSHWKPNPKVNKNAEYSPQVKRSVDAVESGNVLT